MNNKQALDPEDVQLFRQTIGDVVAIKQNTVLPVKLSSRIPAQTVPDYHTKRQPFHADEFIPEEFRASGSEQIQFRRSGLQDKVFRKLKRGQLPIQAKLDLHGMTAFNAKLALDRFLEHSQANKRQHCVRVIHGKGYGSKDGQPKLKQLIQIWLQECKNVLAYCSCIPASGGTGAIYLLLKGSND